jgi:hypothetical protein
MFNFIKRKRETPKLPGRMRKGRPFEIILAALDIFHKIGRKEISLTELQESIAEFQTDFGPLGYVYSSRFLYSLDLLSDLDDLVFNGYIHQFEYKYDGFLPNRYLTLTSIGKGRGKIIVGLLPEDTLKKLESSVTKSEHNYKKRWQLWAR